jgi:hypothetical protein
MLADGTAVAGQLQGFPGEAEGTSGVATSKFMGAGAYRGDQAMRGGGAETAASGSFPSSVESFGGR